MQMIRIIKLKLLEFTNSCIISRIVCVYDRIYCKKLCKNFVKNITVNIVMCGSHMLLGVEKL